ncbi:MAG TPA: hypothetical protein VM939_11630 [Gemmatimonadaceae bacterium]|nr:hypothetical protein [Gemmatimonadaceae bacterium]
MATSTTATQQTAATNGIQDKAASDSIDQVRDLLFGAQMRTVDARIQALEERMLQETTAIRAELRESVKTLENRISTELNKITGQLQADKLDSSALAAGLTDLAARISAPRSQASKQATKAEA